MAGRSIFRGWLGAARRNGRYVRNVVIVGANADGAELVDLLTCHDELGFRVVGVLGDRDQAIANGLGGLWCGVSDAAPTVLRDRRATGFDRTALLSAFAQRSGSRIVSANGAIALVRDGRTARHIGPLFADHAAAALVLVSAITQSQDGPLLLDAVASQAAFLEGLTASGWTIERPFQRMRFGPATATGEETPFAVAGPEFG